VSTADVRTVIFDLFGVIALSPDEPSVRRMESLLPLAPDLLWERYWQFRRSYDLGELDGHGFWEAVSGRLLQAAEAELLVRTDVASWSGVDGAVVDWLRVLKDRGLSVGVLSNLPRDLYEWHLRADPALKMCDHVSASCLTGLAKPDPEAFSSALAAMGADPRQTLLIDDHLPNVETAQRLGMRAVLYRRGMTLEECLAA
jgi:putative hydrolase of the HAD superfamily